MKCPPCCPTPPLAARLKEASARQSVLRRPTLTRHLPDTQRLPRVWALGRCSKGGGGTRRGLEWGGGDVAPSEQAGGGGAGVCFSEWLRAFATWKLPQCLAPKSCSETIRFSKSEAATVSIFVYVWSRFQLGKVHSSILQNSSRRRFQFWVFFFSRIPQPISFLSAVTFSCYLKHKDQHGGF